MNSSMFPITGLHQSIAQKFQHVITTTDLSTLPMNFSTTGTSFLNKLREDDIMGPSSKVFPPRLYQTAKILKWKNQKILAQTEVPVALAN